MSMNPNGLPWSCALALALALGPLAAQTPPAPPIDPNLPSQLKELKTLVSEPKMADDFRAISLLEKLVEKPAAAYNPKDVERLAKGIGEVFRTGKLRTGDKEMLYRQASDSLGKLAADGAKELAKALDDARFKDAISLRAHMTLALGATEDEKQIESLLDVLSRSPHDELRAAAGEALGKHTNMDIKNRREVVKMILRAWGSLHEKSTQGESSDPNAPINLEPQNARRTLRAVEGKWVATLQKLTGTTHAAFLDWQRWLNKNPNWTPPAAAKKP